MNLDCTFTVLQGGGMVSRGVNKQQESFRGLLIRFSSIQEVSATGGFKGVFKGISRG